MLNIRDGVGKETEKPPSFEKPDPEKSSCTLNRDVLPERDDAFAKKELVCDAIE